MKPISIFIFALCATSQITAASAATKCVKLTSSTTCTGTQIANKADWSGTCTTGGTSVSTTGVAVCSNQSGNKNGTSQTITTSETLTDNKNCWCKMVSPAVSPWVLQDSYSYATSCETACSSYCAYSLQFTSAFRTAMFSNMSD